MVPVVFVNVATVSAQTAGPDYAAGQAAEASGDTGRAITAYERYVKGNPNAAMAADAQLRVGLLYEKEEKYPRAFEAYQSLIDNYPNSPDFDKAVERQFNLANLYLNGERVKLLGIPTIQSQDKAVEMFTKVIANAPFSTYAPLSQFNIGQAREKQDRTDEAIAAYLAVVEKYPTHDVADDAQFQIGYLYMKAAQSGAQDTSSMQRAIEAFEDFLYQYPDSPKAAQAKENLSGLQIRVTEDALEVAKFYDKSKNYKAAAIYYSDVIRDQPNTEAAAYAEKRLQAITSKEGADVTKIGTGKADTPTASKERARMRSKVDVSNRPDYAGPPIPRKQEEETEVTRKKGPSLRTSEPDTAPVDLEPMPATEPALPTDDQLLESAAEAATTPAAPAAPTTPEAAPAP
jgi:outer membrane protein assembly factor BamD